MPPVDSFTATVIFSVIYGVIMVVTGFRTAVAIKRRNRQHILVTRYATWILMIVSVVLPLLIKAAKLDFEIHLSVTIPATVIGYILGCVAGAWLTPWRNSGDDSWPDSGDSVHPRPAPPVDSAVSR